MGYFSHSSALKLVYFAVIFVVIVKGFASLLLYILAKTHLSIFSENFIDP